jgi:protein SCO1
MRLISLRFVLALICALGAARASSSYAEEPLPFGGPFALTAKGGTKVSQESFPGKTLLIVFGFTHCPDMCPTSLAAIAEAMKLLGLDADKVQTLFITVDPARDTPDLLADYVAAFDPRFIGLSGTEGEIAAVARSFRLHRLKVKTGAEPSGYTVDHGTLIYVVNAAGKTVSIIPHNADGPRIAKVVGKYIRQPAAQ